MVMGHLLARLAETVQQSIPTLKTFCIGISLGGQLCGFAGKDYRHVSKYYDYQILAVWHALLRSTQRHSARLAELASIPPYYHTPLKLHPPDIPDFIPGQDYYHLLALLATPLGPI